MKDIIINRNNDDRRYIKILLHEYNYGINF